MRAWIAAIGGAVIGGLFAVFFSDIAADTGRLVGVSIFVGFCAAGWIDFTLSTLEFGTAKATTRRSTIKA